MRPDRPIDGLTSTFVSIEFNQGFVALKPLFAASIVTVDAFPGASEM